MKAFTFRMWQNDRYIDLKDILDLIDANELRWWVLEVEGFGPGPLGMSILDFEDLVADRGCAMSWDELSAWAKGMHQVIWCEIVAVPQADTRTVATLRENRSAGVPYVLVGFDATTWEIETSDPDFAARLRDRFVQD